MDCGPPGSSLHGILQARTLEYVAIPFSRESFQPKDGTWVSCIAGRFFTIWTTRGSYSWSQTTSGKSFNLLILTPWILPVNDAMKLKEDSDFYSFGVKIHIHYYVNIVKFLDKSVNLCALCFITQLCPTLCDPKDCSLPGTSVHWDSPDRNTRVGCHALLKLLIYHPSQQGVDHIFIIIKATIISCSRYSNHRYQYHPHRESQNIEILSDTTYFVAEPWLKARIYDCKFLEHLVEMTPPWEWRTWLWSPLLFLPVKCPFSLFLGKAHSIMIWETPPSLWKHS